MITLFPDITIIPMWGLFMVAFLALYFWVFKPTLALIEARKQKTELLKTEAEALTLKTAEMQKNYDIRMSQVRSTVGQEREKLIEEARSQERVLVAQARSESESIRKKWDEELVVCRDETKKKLDLLTSEISQLMVEKALKVFLFFAVTGFTGLALASEGANPKPDSAILFRFVNFAILFVILYFVLRKPARNFFQTRAGSIKMNMEEASLVFNTASTGFEAIDKKNRHFDEETKTFKREVMEQAKVEKEKMIENAKLLAASIKNDAERVGQTEKTKLIEELKKYAADKARGLAETKIKTVLDDKKEESLERDFLKTWN